ncbi:MAG: TAXI family TRAP transporter solute-binding subunit [Pseudomonadota bacterium]
MKNLTKMALGLSAALAFAAPASAQSTMTAETACAGGAPGTTVITLGELAAAEGIANLQVTDCQTLTNSLQNLVEGRTDIAAAPFILPFLMSKGAGPYAKMGKEKGAELIQNARMLYTYRFGIFALYAYDSSPVKGWGDLEGKRVLNGPPRGGALTNGRAIIKLATGLDDGEGYEGVQMTWGQMPQAIADNSVDAMMLPSYFPDTRITRALSAGSVTLWGIPKELFEGEGFQKYAKAPGSGAMIVDVAEFGTQEGLTIVPDDDGKLRAIATVGGDLVHKDMDFDTAKALTAAMIANFDSVVQKAPFMRFSAFGELDPAVASTCGPNVLKYHPGAVAAWEEAGYTVPDCAKPDA